jgi:cytochrome o ubiquinol oxidase subunit 1
MVLSFIVWLHHFFTMGSGANVNAFFGITTMIISIPTGVKIFNWLFTMYRGRVQFTSPVLWTLGFMITFVIGGMTGVLMAVPAADFVLHNSLFLIAHFHNVIIGGVLFGYLAGVTYWWPKAFGFKLNERLGKCAFWCWLVGFYFAFMPLYVLGLMGMTRRLNHTDNPAWTPWLHLAVVGVVFVALGIFFQVLQIVVSIRDRKKLADVTGDPWGGRTLEWATSSPPAFYNFAHTPVVRDLDAFADMKARGETIRTDGFEQIHMPKNTAAGFYMGAFSLVLGFALTWHIWWLAAVGLIGMVVAFIRRANDDHIDYYVPASEVEQIETRYQQRIAAQG